MTANILIVDDIEQNIKVLKERLITEYYTVYTVDSGFAALEILKTHKIDVILMDGMMPNMDGFETCRRIKANPDTTHIPVVMVTALSDVEDRVKGLEAGADEFLTKPPSDIALFARVRSLSRTKSVLDELKLRNRTSAELGGQVIEFIDHFSDAKIVVIDDDAIQVKNINKTLFKLTENIKVVSSLDVVESTVTEFIPDLVIISCQITSGDPLRVTAMLRSMDILKNSPIMLLAEEENMTIVGRGMELGANDYFIYPVDEHELIARIKTQLRRKQYQEMLRNELEESVNLSVKDGLTGAFNRRYFDIHIEQLAKKAAETGTPFCLVMIDIDYFKKVNDEYGHQAGDEVLRKVTGVIKDQLRITDLFVRYGGEEFVVILSDVDLKTAMTIADRLRVAVSEIEISLAGLEKPLHKTISMGVAEFNSAEQVKKLVARADKALYAAKESGRNKIVVG